MLDAHFSHLGLFLPKIAHVAGRFVCDSWLTVL